MASRRKTRAISRTGRTSRTRARFTSAMLGKRLIRRLPLDAPVPTPVNSVLAGRRNNPPDEKAGIRALAVYNPIHYQELPELFMDFIASLTGKSPSTTGAGSEGALTKGPFNAILPVHDLNAALGFLPAHRLSRLHQRRRPHRPEIPLRSRHQPARPGGLVAHVHSRARAATTSSKTAISKNSRTSNTTARPSRPAASATASPRVS